MFQPRARGANQVRQSFRDKRVGSVSSQIPSTGNETARVWPESLFAFAQADCQQPFPAWKRIDVIAHALSDSDRRQVMDSDGMIPAEAYAGEDLPATDQT